MDVLQKKLAEKETSFGNLGVMGSDNTALRTLLAALQVR